MNWLEQLLFDSNSIAHIVLLYTAVISLGVYLGKIKFFGISLGVTIVLQDFGLILFVYCIGLQVGPGFFESFKKGGVTLNLLACGIVALNILVMLVLYYCVFDTNDPRNLPMMVGVLCGAVTNTPGLGAATEALTQVFANAQAVPQIASGYACAYPLGVVGIIAATISIRYICGIVLKDENEKDIQEKIDEFLREIDALYPAKWSKLQYEKYNLEEKNDDRNYDNVILEFKRDKNSIFVKTFNG